MIGTRCPHSDCGGMLLYVKPIWFYDYGTLYGPTWTKRRIVRCNKCGAEAVI